MDPIPLSALNHFLYCPRRAYLIHAEGVFVDNEHTALGHLAHEAVDHPGYEQRAGWTLLRALPLYSDTLGLSGKADLVDVRYADPDSQSRTSARQVVAEVHPVEYKKGRRKHWNNDEAQLCAQAFCLEEMFGLTIASGAIYHAGSERRSEVVFDDPLRRLTLDTLAALRASLTAGDAPPAELKPQCDGCSLRPVCLPEAGRSAASLLFEPRTY